MLRFYKLKQNKKQQQNSQTLEFHSVYSYLENISPASEKYHLLPRKLNLSQENLKIHILHVIFLFYSDPISNGLSCMLDVEDLKQ